MNVTGTLAEIDVFGAALVLVFGGWYLWNIIFQHKLFKSKAAKEEASFCMPNWKTAVIEMELFLNE